MESWTRRLFLGSALAMPLAAVGCGVRPPEKADDSVDSQPTLPAVDVPEHLATFSYVGVAASFPVRDPGSDTWVQGFAVNETAGEIYVATQATGGTLLTITIRDLMGSVKSAKSFPIMAGAYTESLPWWHEPNGDLCFIVRTGAGASRSDGQNTYALYNYTTGELGEKIPIRGAIRMSVVGDEAVTTDAGTTSVTRFSVYDWGSVKAGTPALLRTVQVVNPGATVGKNQGMSATDEYFILNHAKNGEPPAFTIYDYSGGLEGVESWDKAGFARTLNSLLPGLITDPASFNYEAEGSYFAGGRYLSGHTLYSGSDADAATMVILSHGNLNGGHVPPRSFTEDQ